ncbi:hypothetical protein FDK21_19900 [Cohaesibacter sp. CAU 1516]|uniref:hypothetical protein n=1 Tax=Cohaesibacter sp. CAU 1516 TaxID=2576038 RepID=UPI0010FEE9E6|nr:hypothetical protein [Cohaesibacter sp. CAU 1516]TLP42348.1 hypothetical protein FDK21_19900 [Cohaesibacter sp. CAU 1516]
MSMMETMDMAAMRDMMSGGCEDCESMMNRASAHCSFQATILPLIALAFPSQLTSRDPFLLEQTPYARSFSPEPPPPRL